MSPPKSSSVERELAVSVVVTNQIEAPREGSVGKVEKRAMSEFWFKADESKSSNEHVNGLRNMDKLLRTSRFRITLYDQERRAITSTISPN